MNITRREFSFRIGLALAWIAAVPAIARAQSIVFEKAEVTLVTRSGSHVFMLDVADTKQKTTLGLRFRHNIPPDGGMLYPLSLMVPTPISVQGLALPTDILFVSRSGRVVEIYPWVLPNSDAPIQAKSPAFAALQLAGGTTARFGVRVGDRVLNPMFGQTV